MPGRMFEAELLPVEGQAVRLQLKPDISLLCKLLDCDIFQTVRTAGGVMLVDDNGLRKGLPRNERASELYAGGHIVGPAVLFSAAEWQAFDDAFAP